MLRVCRRALVVHRRVVDPAMRASNRHGASWFEAAHHSRRRYTKMSSNQ
jgi:hypothetical protein